jgi:flagellar biosynthesis/type III secretory pathway M-ring protein FliF/YscJ
MRTMRSLKRFRLVSFVLAIFLLLGMMVEPASAQRRRRNPQAGKAKAAKRIGIGTAIGAGAGALINGKKGALIGAGAGAAGGTAYHVHKKRQYRRRHRNY